jgi:hypothetical protein
MFTALELHYITLIFKYCTKLPTSSFKFRDGELEADKRKVKIYFRYFKIFLWALNFIVLLSKFPSTLSSRYFPHIVMNVLETIIPIGVSTFQISTSLYQDEILTLVKQTLAFNKEFGEWIFNVGGCIDVSYQRQKTTVHLAKLYVLFYVDLDLNVSLYLYRLFSQSFW